MSGRSAPKEPAALAARTEVVVDSAFGIRLEDPYRWMEKAENPEFLDWMRSQGAFARHQLDAIPIRLGIETRSRELAFEIGCPYALQRRGAMLFYQRLDAGRSLSRLFVRSADGAERVLVDTEALGVPGKRHVSLDNYAASPDGGLVAYNLSSGGDEVTRVHVVNTATGAQIPDVIERIWSEFSVNWLPDASGFLYTQMAEEALGDPRVDPIQGMRVRLHKLGTSPPNDPVLLGSGSSSSMNVDPRELPMIDVPPNSPYAIAIASGARTNMRVYVARLGDLRPGATPWRRVAEYEDVIEAVAIADSSLYLLSSKDVPNRQILRTPLSNPNLAHAAVVVPHSERVLVNLVSAKDGLYIVGMDRGVDRLFRIQNGRGRAEEVPLPVEGSINSLVADLNHDGAIFSLEGWTEPREFYEWRPQSKHLADLGLCTPSSADFSGILVERVEVRSFDGAMVPLTILRQEDLKLDRSHPAVLRAYGGYGSSITATFGPSRLALLEHGAVLAYAHVRGGGEKGRDWYLAGKGPNKPNGIRDFIACAEYLQTKGYTSPSKLAAAGSSMGGVLVGSAIVQRPDLFGAGVIYSGVLNPVRYLHGPNGASHLAELGSPDTEEGLRALIAMDPTMAVRSERDYPPVLLTVGLNDNRVAPWHTGKFAARLLATRGTVPVLIRIDPEAGHGIGSTRDQVTDLMIDTNSFLLWHLGLGRPR